MSGCVIWLLTFCLLGSCLIPVAAAVGGITSTLNANYVARLLGPTMCPEGSMPKVHTYATTSQDENGFEHPSTGYEVRCENADGRIVKNLGPTYAFVWTGILMSMGLVTAGVLAFLFAAPVGAFIGRLTNRSAKTPGL